MYKNQAQNDIQKQPYISLQKLGENKFVRGITNLIGCAAVIIGAYKIAKTVSSYSPEVDAAELQKNLNNTKSIECILSEVDVKDMKEEFWPKWLPEKYRKLIGELPAAEVRIEGDYLKFIDEPLFPFDYSYQWTDDEGNTWKTKLICEGDSGAELTSFVGKEKDLVNIKKIGKIIEARQLKVHAQETEYKPVPYVLLGSQVVGMQTITPFTKEDKGNIASLENSFYGDNFNKYVSPLEEKASSIKDEIVISNQGEIFKIKTGKIDSAEYLVGIKKIGEISEHNRKMSDSGVKAKLGEEARKRGIDTLGTSYDLPSDFSQINTGIAFVGAFQGELNQTVAGNLINKLYDGLGTVKFWAQENFRKIKPDKKYITTIIDKEGNEKKAYSNWIENKSGYMLIESGELKNTQIKGVFLKKSNDGKEEVVGLENLTVFLDKEMKRI